MQVRPFELCFDHAGKLLKRTSGFEFSDIKMSKRRHRFSYAEILYRLRFVLSKWLIESVKFVVRFAIGDARGLRSSVWRVWKGRKKDDLYIAPRPMVSVLKGSLHASGLCYFSITAHQHAQMMATGTAREKRALTRWKRLPTPASWLCGSGMHALCGGISSTEFYAGRRREYDSH
jgi:hypothetical protein